MKLTSIAKILVILLFTSACGEDDPGNRPFPEVKTLPVTNISPDGATFNAEITSRGNFEIIAYGFEYREVNGLANEKVTILENIHQDQFSINVSSTLKPIVDYQVKAFLQTSELTILGQEVKFKSLGSKSPIIHRVNPLKIFYGDTVSIYGENFSSSNINNIVSLGLTNARVVFSSDSLVKALIPIDVENTTLDVSLSVSGNASFFNGTLSFKAPQITGLSMNEVVYGDTLKILGHYFGFTEDLNTLRVNENEVQPLSLDSTEIKFILPVVSEPIEILVVNSLGQEDFNDDLSILKPMIKEISPDNGFYGDKIEINGKNFSHIQSVVKVSFNELEASITDFSNESISAIVPEGVHNPIAITLQVVNQGQTQSTFYYQGPEISKIEPTNGTWGDEVSITGNNFSDIPSENLVSAEGVEFTVKSSSNDLMVIEIMDEIQTKAFKLSVNINGIEEPSNQGFTLNDPQIIDVTPSFVKSVNEEITITGNNFNPLSKQNSVRLNGRELQITTTSKTEIKALIPSNLLGNHLITINLQELVVSNYVGSKLYDGFTFDHQTPWSLKTDFNVFNIHGSFTIGDRGYIIMRDRKMYEYSFSEDKWTRRASFPGEDGVDGNRNFGVAFALDGKGYYGLGGIKCIHKTNPNFVCGKAMNDLWQYTPGTNSWTRLADVPLSGAHNQVTVNDNDVYLMRLDGNGHSVLLYDALNDSWTNKSIIDTTNPRSGSLRCLVSNQRLYSVFQTWDSNDYFLYAYDQSIDQWSHIFTLSSLDHIYRVAGIGGFVFFTDLHFSSATSYTSNFYSLNLTTGELSQVESPSNHLAVIPFVQNGHLFLDGLDTHDPFLQFDPNF